MSSTALFDRIAERYDEVWTNSPEGRAQRDQVWREVDGLFREGERILDIGCGTGEDAAHFAARGVDVYGIDASPAMIDVARRRGGFRAEVCGAEEIARIGGTFDGAISNFGALNCVEDLGAVAESLAGMVRPGGRVAICLMGRFCAGESLYYGARGQWGKAVRRWTGRAMAEGMPVYYPTVREVRRAFEGGFELRRWVGIGVRAVGDHRLFIFVRKAC